MKKTLFLTGYPGFLATYLMKQLLKDHGEAIAHIYVLVLATEKEKARKKIEYYTKTSGISNDFFSIVVGDITENNLAIDKQLQRKLQQEVTHVFHLAAVYDLAVPQELAERVNIHGTKRVNEWVQTLVKLERYIYFSTAYVSGKREGRIYEHELEQGQTFRNHYERTKYVAEVLVESLKTSVPTTIIRPGIVKGHAETGETIKFDGLYFMLNFYDKLRMSPFLPYLQAGAAESPEGNFVPSDYVLKATSFLAMNPVGAGKTYHLTDPQPYNMVELQKMLAEYYLGRKPKGTIPVSIVKSFLKVAPIRKMLQVEAEAMDYFTIRSSYDATNAQQDLRSANIICPDLKDTLPAMIQFYRKYKDDLKKHIIIQ